jgi:hypothetical protein
VTWLQGDDIYVAHQIKLIAESYLKDECINRGTRKEMFRDDDVFNELVFNFGAD